MTSRTRVKLVRERSLRQQIRARRLRKQLLNVERLEDRRLLAADFIANEVLVQFEADNRSVIGTSIFSAS